MMTISDNDAIHAEHAKALDETGFWGRQGAGCLFLAKSTGRLLVSHRSADVLEPCTWGTWGGAIDAMEGPRMAVLREAREEAGYQGDCTAHAMAVFNHPSGFRYFNFIVTVECEFDPQLDWETQGYAWIEPQELISGQSVANPMHPGLRYFLDQSHEEIVALAQQYLQPAPPAMPRSSMRPR